MNKRIYFNAFHMNCVVHQSPGLWVREDDNMVNYTDLNQWVELAKLLERGRVRCAVPGRCGRRVRCVSRQPGGGRV